MKHYEAVKCPGVGYYATPRIDNERSAPLMPKGGGGGYCYN